MKWFPAKETTYAALMFFSWGRITGSLTCFWWVSLTERLQTSAVSLQKPTIIWLFQDLGKLPSQLAKHRLKPGPKATVSALIEPSLTLKYVNKYHEMQRLRCNHDIQVLLTKKKNFCNSIKRKLLPSNIVLFHAYWTMNDLTVNLDHTSVSLYFI